MPNGINRSINCVSVLEATNDSQRHAISSEETYKRNKEGSKNKTHGIFPVANSPHPIVTWMWRQCVRIGSSDIENKTVLRAAAAVSVDKNQRQQQ